MPCPGQFHFSHIAVYLHVFFPLSDPYVGLSILVCDVEHSSFHFGLCGRTCLFCACLVSVHVSAPYVIAGSTQQLHNCPFRQMARLLFKYWML